ncbi:PBP1A family penicillin-binding protein [Candidatus Sumerlaeota bacterium]|nr:PBP1A family penicillin-binding protein [Candidatus Sumerlaeota bacterium]
MFLTTVTIGTLGASTVVGLFIGYVNGLPPIERLENYDPPQVTMIYDRTGAEIGRFSSERRQVMAIDEIPLQLKRAFLAIEDERFYEHFGVDLRAGLGAARANFQQGKIVRGASTITMQLPRNILDDQVGREKTWERKIRETFLTFQIERRYSKDQILEFYLNHIFMGYQAFGIHAAADTYFDKAPRELSLAECATLAAIPRGPTIYNPLANPDRALRRRNLVLDRMAQLGWISDEARERAIEEPLETRRRRRPSNVAQSRFPYFVDGLYRDLTGFYKLTPEDITTRGLLVSSTIDPVFQTIVEEELRKGLAQAERDWNLKKVERFAQELRDYRGSPEAGQTRLAKIVATRKDSIEVELEGYRGAISIPANPPYYEPDNVLRVGNRIDVRITKIDHLKETLEGKLADASRIQGSVVILDARSGDILALVGGADFHDAANNGQYNRALQGGRSAGSTVKPFFYATALENGFAPHDQIVDEPIEYAGNYRPRNYENTYFGATTLIEALEHSRNVVTVRLFDIMGRAQGFRTTLDRVARFDSAPGDARWRKKFRPELPVCLGSVDMNTLELAAAYRVFVNQGIERRPQFFRAITGRDGNTAVSPDTRETIVIDPVVAYQMITMLRQVVLTGTARRLIGASFPSPPYPPIGGKTGTTDNTTDAWFVGFTPDLVMVCYVGYDTPRSMGPQMTGGRVAGPIWAQIFKRIFTEREDWRMSFESPAGLETAEICARTGKRASEVCASRGHKTYPGFPYRIGEAPRELCDGLPRRAIGEPAGARAGSLRSGGGFGSDLAN